MQYRVYSSSQLHCKEPLLAGKGGNFIDTAEVYATPMGPSYCGKAEEYIGAWLRKRGCRDDFIIATKV